MKKMMIGTFFLFLSAFPFCGFTLAESRTAGLPAGEAYAFLGGKDIFVKPDNFDGCLFFYNDEEGNRCATNSVNILIAESDFGRKEERGWIKDQWVLNERDKESDELAGDLEPDELEKGIPDPLEKMNRAFFQFNDRLYFWFLKPVASGYATVVPLKIRKGVKNLFTNLTFPVRFVNCLFQGKIEGAGDELSRFVLNSTIGIAGLVDVGKVFDIKGHDEDLGQTLATYGVGSGFFIVWPVLGPSSARGTVGSAGDGFLDPLNYIDHTKYIAAVRFYEAINNTSLVIGEYEDLKRAALDPYIAMRNAYYQHRLNKIKE